MANRTRDEYERVRMDRRTSRLRGGAFGGDYARDDWPYGLGGDYAWDDWRRGFSGDYARDERWRGAGAGQARGTFAGDRPSYRGVGPKNYQRSDVRIAEEVNDVLTEDDRLDASAIEVDVKEGEVTLTGAVSDREARRRAEDLAIRCFGVKHVHNRLRVEDDVSDVHIGKASE